MLPSDSSWKSARPSSGTSLAYSGATALHADGTSSGVVDTPGQFEPLLYATNGVFHVGASSLDLAVVDLS